MLLLQQDVPHHRYEEESHGRTWSGPGPGPGTDSVSGGCPETVRNLSVLCLLWPEESRNMNQLDDFMECLAKFTRYNSVRPLATLSYASDLYNGSSIVSR